MLQKFKSWFFNLFKSAEHELALEATKCYIGAAIADALKEMKVLEDARHEKLKAYIAAELLGTSGSVSDLKQYIAGEICKRYDSLVTDAGAAARLMEHSKIVQALCDHCHLPSRRFSISRVDGKTICASCAAKGIK